MDEAAGAGKQMKNENQKALEMMLKIRIVESTIAERYKFGKMRCPVHLSIGQEMIPSIISTISRKDDYAVSTHRGHAHYIAKGGKIRELIAELHGKKDGCALGIGGSMHLIDTEANFMGTSAIVGNSIGTGTGLALAAKLNKQNQISIIYLGDAATEEGIFGESINFAATKKIPAIFVCEDNMYSVYSNKTDRRHKDFSLKKLTEAHGVDFQKITGKDSLNDALSKTRYAFEKSRTTQAPCVIEAETYRILEHCGPNNDINLGYRTKSELRSWKSNDIVKKEILNMDREQRLLVCKFVVEMKKDIDEAFDLAERSEALDAEKLTELVR